MTFSRGFTGHGRSTPELPPGQYLVEDFPVLSAGPTQHVTPEDWELHAHHRGRQAHPGTGRQFQALPHETPTVDLHCVTKWSKLGTHWEGISLDTLLEDVETAAEYAFISSYGGYTTNLPLEDLQDGKAWLAFKFDGEDLEPVHGGPVRLLVPHLYLWKSAKWVKGIDLRLTDDPGFWETLGYNNYGDPWREQRYWGD